ncbi:MAG: bifunctional D-glycero-beta-D-manno-heptose-7-phosphate kinase/D-glycero-beta-D-manno-heptose 1-phosphate adenylyltransferase HldE [Gammaproteobacteria bacterium]|nr:bifunctional D-glycero-beta-D-manno-heptose-7-phosphate kinase/D-glycero-beta-D-manno-heptose 1-phosphate adenylyltransferase HldE [Gammaproteobacteria bacterium]
MTQMLPPASSAHVVVVGDVMVDRYWFGATDRVSQEAPVPVVAIESTENRPGGAANVALNIVSLGARCTLIGAVGNDDTGSRLAETLMAAGVVCDLVSVDDWQTPVKLRIVSKNQQLLRADFETLLSGAAAREIEGRLMRALSTADTLVLSDYDKGVVARPEVLIQAANAASVPVVVDPKHKDLKRYAGAYLLKPNRSEFRHAAGAWQGEAELAAKATSLMTETDTGAVIVTRGDEGLTVIEKGRNDPVHIPAVAVDVYDVTGAGDTVVATLGVTIAAGWNLEDSARAANVAAGLACAKMGTAAVTAPEVNQALARTERTDLGTLSQEQLLIAVQRARAQGERIVFTNGCFDILHAGHVGYLEDAREIGDRLIVAVNDDASTSRLKGAGRPVNQLARRMRVLQGLASVDWVVSFSEDTPLALLDQIRPDVLVKGGDYTTAEVVGAELVQSYHGEVRVLSLVEDCSTADIVDRIKSA